MLSEENVTIFELKMITLQGYIFRVLQHFATKLGNSTNFRMLVLDEVKDFVLLA